MTRPQVAPLRRVRLLLTLLLAVCAALIARPGLASSPTIWFCPLDSLIRGDRYGGSLEYMELFKPGSPWKKAASHVNVFKIYPQWIDSATDDNLRIQFADLKRRHIALALEFGVLSPTDGWVSEGYGGQNHHLLLAVERIKRDGGELKYIAMDEPMFFGTVYRTGSFKPLTPDQMADDAAVNIKEMWTEFPNVLVGDIEPLTTTSTLGLTDQGLIARYRDGILAFGRALGRPLAFFDSDLDWHANQWPSRLAADYKLSRSLNIPFGVIYNSDESDSDNAAWLQTARLHMAASEEVIGTPRLVIFQSWNPYPRKLLPETDQDAFTSLINTYFAIRTRIGATINGSRLGGRLESKQGVPVAGAKVYVTLHTSNNSGTIADYLVTGHVPAGTKIAVIGIRVNNEGASVGNCDVQVKDLRLELSGQPPVVRTFVSNSYLNQWPALRPSPDGARASVEHGLLHLIATPSQSLLLNSAPFAVTAPSSFRFNVSANIPINSIGNGYFTVVFVGDEGEIQRTSIPFDEPTITIPPLTTTSTGRFTATIPGSSLTIAKIQYNGDTTHWPASVILK